MGTKLTLPRDLAARYKPLAILGTGGMAVVIKAQDKQLKRAVAIKLSHAAMHSEALFDRYVREARMVARISSRHVVQVFDGGVADNQPYLVMEYLTGAPLSLILKDSVLTPQLTRSLLMDILEGLACAHDTGVLHRDIKPANIVIRNDGSPVLIDFGLARDIEASEIRQSNPNTVLGTPLYMAPELVTGQPRWSFASDLFSLAVVGIEMTSRESLHGVSGGSLSSVTSQVFSSLSSGTYHAVARRLLQGKGALAEPLLKALSPDPFRRHASARAMLEELRTPVQESADQPSSDDSFSSSRPNSVGALTLPIIQTARPPSGTVRPIDLDGPSSDGVETGDLLADTSDGTDAALPGPPPSSGARVVPGSRPSTGAHVAPGPRPSTGAHVAPGPQAGSGARAGSGGSPAVDPGETSQPPKALAIAVVVLLVLGIACLVTTCRRSVPDAPAVPAAPSPR